MMRKKWIAMLLVFLLLLSGCGGEDAASSGNETSASPGMEQGDGSFPQGGKIPGKLDGKQQDGTADPVLDALQAEIADSDALFGVAYLGYAELPSWEDVCVYVEANGFSDEFPFLLDIMENHAVLQEGGEVYAVVPASKEVSLTISEFLMGEDAYIPNRGEDLLTVTDGKPLLLRGNISEIVPNLLITAEKGSKSLEYNPCISGMDGSLVVDEGIYDFTPYELVSGSYPDYDPLPDAIFTLNTWYAQHYDRDGNLFAMTLMLNPDGTVEYSYGQPYGGIFEKFAGTWSEEYDDDAIGGTRIILDMTGGPVDNLGVAIANEQYETTCEFTWDFQGSALVLCHEEGAPLLYGTDGDWYTFMSFDGFHMVNNWTSLSEYRNWCYDLQLFENEECIFSIGEVGGSQMASYQGWWYLTEENTLRLNLLLCSGEHPESPELEYISGEYLVENWEATSMTLSYVSGDILTLDMEENTRANFFGY